MDYYSLARQILDLAGGPDNIESFTNCMTRLRLNLVQPHIADVEAIKDLDGVLGVVEGTQLQVVVGPGHAERLRASFGEVIGSAGSSAVNDTDAVTTSTSTATPTAETSPAVTEIESAAISEDDTDLAARTRAKVRNKQTSRVQAMFRHVGNIFVPIIPGFISCGLVTAICGIWKMVDPAVANDGWFLVLAGLGGIVIASLNLIVGYNTAQECGGSPILGLIAGGVPYMPALAGTVATDKAAGVPLTIPVFGELNPGLGGVIGVMITAWLFTVIENRLRKVVPAAIELFFVPTVTLLLGAAASIFVIMPLSSLLMKRLTWLLVDFALAKGGIIGGFILSTFFLPMVMLGIHQGLTPIHAQLIANHGYTELLPILAMAGAGQVGMAIAVLMKTRSQKLMSVIKSALPLGILGVGEPLIYGVSLPLLYPFLTACIGGGFGGAFIAWGMQHSGLFGSQALGLSGLLMAPVISAGKWAWYLGGWLVAVIMGWLLTFLFGFKDSMAERIMD
ncbi:PTS tagatose transporter subunit IIABC [Cutibacterium sp. WCA-380-WT-3A]|uniref:PTS tagatose transporter subunit IIABC n=1 Tax=Cutibacterium porci TaxID=2605781 RepID=A0A7K0J6R0_9ACTN|nr:PTS transporter subunit EIIC [Cutibacterium porci]MSS45513.1 PTS tagatose transporter subunit IIABC [Cutibacterium porci]